MNASEEFVHRLASKTFLSLWCVPNPHGKESFRSGEDMISVSEWVNPSRSDCHRLDLRFRLEPAEPYVKLTPPMLEKVLYLSRTLRHCTERR